MKTAIGIVGGLLIGVAVGWGVALSYSEEGSVVSISQEMSPSSVPVLELDGTKLKSEELPTSIQSLLFEKQREYYEAASSVVQQFAVQLALAKARDPKVKAEALPTFDELLGLARPSTEELQVVYEANKGRLPPNTSFDQVKSEIERFIQNQKLTETIRAKTQEFKDSGRLKLLLVEPQPPKVDLKLHRYPSRGPTDANVVLVEASDYLCPHCQQMQPEVTQILREFEGKLRFVQINYSLNPDGLSGALIRGATCARKLGDDKFWAFHEAAFKVATDRGWKATDPEDKSAVLTLAKEVGIEDASFAACFDSPESRQGIVNNNEFLKSHGLSGTPTFYLNDRRILHHVSGLRGIIATRLAGNGR